MGYITFSNNTIKGDYQIFELVKKHFVDTYVILTTAFEYKNETIIKAFRDGALDWIPKAPQEGDDKLYECPTCKTEVLDEDITFRASFPTCAQCETPLRKVWYDFHESFKKAFPLIDLIRVTKAQRKEIRRLSERVKLPELYEVTIVQKDPADVLAPIEVYVSEKKN